MPSVKLRMKQENTYSLCKYSEEVWSSLRIWQGISSQPKEWSIEQSWAETYARGKNGSVEIYRIALAVVPAIWQERNLIIFQDKRRNADVLIRMIVQDIHARGVAM